MALIEPNHIEPNPNNRFLVNCTISLVSSTWNDLNSVNNSMSHAH